MEYLVGLDPHGAISTSAVPAYNLNIIDTIVAEE
jgi:hypothetical protein